MGVRVGEGVHVRVGEPVGEGEGVPVREGVLLEEPVCDGEGDCVPVGEPVALLEGVPVSEPVEEALPVALLEALEVALLEDEPVPVPVPAGVGGGVREGEEDALRRVAMLRPRMVMEDTAASAPPASHSSEDSRTPLVMRMLCENSVTLEKRKQPA